MATGSKNAKSQSVTVRVLHELIDGMEQTKEQNESTGQFVSTAMRAEIKRRQRKAKASSE
ncbi:YlcI/YnfO family protein [Xenorhabdus sp. SGI246]|uniref:YlcI/YnfO family protein n=1 Tax=Xenorhabdus sp. SGI246 TaxID=3158263 RepID=UPI00349F23B7